MLTPAELQLRVQKTFQNFIKFFLSKQLNILENILIRQVNPIIIFLGFLQNFR